jgi:adenylate kinase family enzyme
MNAKQRHEKLPHSHHGASGAGVTSLGRAVADALAIPHHDTDDYFWQPTPPPYRDKREIADRLRLMREV